MTVSCLIERTDALFPNVFPFPMKVRWLLELDKRINSELLSLYGAGAELSQEEETSHGRELLLGEEQADLYISYLTMKMELHSGNITGYVNCASLFNSAYLSFMQFYNRTHKARETKINID